MKKVTCIWLVLIIYFITSLSGCIGKSVQESIVQSDREQAFMENVRKKEITPVILKSVEVIMNGFETTRKMMLKNQPKTYEKVTKYSDGRIVTESTFSDIGVVMAYFTAKEQSISMGKIIEMVDKIYQSKLKERKMPPSWQEVVIAFIHNIPFMATVAGMYGLGVAGIEKAGTTIHSYADNGSAIAIDKANANRSIYNGSLNTTQPTN